MLGLSEDDPRSKHLLISWLQSPSTKSLVILEPKTIKSVPVSIVSPSICHEVMGPDAMIFVFCPEAHLLRPFKEKSNLHGPRFATKSPLPLDTVQLLPLAQESEKVVPHTQTAPWP